VKRCFILGQPNSGKTLFMINLAEYCGLSSLELLVTDSLGEMKTLSLCFEDARKDLVDPFPHRTLSLQHVTVPLKKGKIKISIQMVDTVGLSDSLGHPEPVRLGMAYTLKQIRSADIVVHIIDAPRAAVDLNVPAFVDLELARYASCKCPYLILANKMDLPRACEGLAKIKATFPSSTVLPMSALKKRGFREVKAHLLRFI